MRLNSTVAHPVPQRMKAIADEKEVRLLAQAKITLATPPAFPARQVFMQRDPVPGPDVPTARGIRADLLDRAHALMSHDDRRMLGPAVQFRIATADSAHFHPQQSTSRTDRGALERAQLRAFDADLDRGTDLSPHCPTLIIENRCRVPRIL